MRQSPGVRFGKVAAPLRRSTDSPNATRPGHDSARHPTTGKKLVQRLRKDRRPGMDLTFSVPKSVSLAWAINQDERIIGALREAVYETMAKDVEPLVCRRVRKGAKAFSRERTLTGNLLYADFLHTTSRPVDGVVDPHLHIHAFVQNLTFDDGECYAAELEEVMRQLPALQAKFHARLARLLQHELGYDVVAVKYRQSGRIKTGWEIVGIDRSTIEKFSTRTTQIEALAEKHSIHDPVAKGDLGAKTRQRKEPGTPIEQLYGVWEGRLTPTERAAFEALRRRAMGSGNSDGKELRLEADRATEAVRYAVEHHLYRSSTVERHQVIGTALEQALTLVPEQVETALAAEKEVIHCKRDIRGAKRDYITTHEVLEAERRMIAFVRDSRGTRLPISRSEHDFKRDWLNDQQKNAVRSVLASKDTVTAVTGGAGTGKSSLMEEAAEAIRASGKSVFVFAPSTGAREVLEAKGFEQAETVEHLLRNEKLHPQLGDQVIWIDEAGLLDVRSMNGVFDIAKAQNARVVLSGDTRQHSSPRRGEAMRLLETEAGLHVARVEAVQRQKGAYKRAVELISRGHEVIDASTGLTAMLAGLDELDKLGKVQELPDENRHATLADAYLNANRAGKSTLVIAPTHAEGEAATTEVRTRLRQAGAIGVETDERSLMQLRSLKLTEAQKGLPSTYRVDQLGNREEERSLVVQFHQNVKGGYIKGERYEVKHDNQNLPFLLPIEGGKPKAIPFNATDRFEVYARSTVNLAPGDRVRFTLGGKAADGRRRISNGRLDEVLRLDKRGNLVLKSGMTVAHDYGHLDLGYVITSHASQGKDVDHAIAAIGRTSLPAVNARQFYVTASRGKQDVTLYVDDKAAVRRAIQQSGEQLSATELVYAQQAATRRAAIDRSRRQQVVIERVRSWWRSHFPKHEAGAANAPRTANRPFGRSPGLSRS